MQLIWNSCQLSFALGPVLQILIIAASNFLLMRRVGPLYENNAWVVYGLHLLFLASYATAIALSMKAVLAILRRCGLGHVLAT